MRDSKETARRFIETNHPECEGAMLAGSCARGEATATSDLDIIILYTGEDRAYRESLLFEDWPVEVFVYTGEAYQNFFASDAERGIPSMPRMVSEAIVLKDAPVVTKIKSEASSIFAAGPSPWDKQKVDHNRYMITNLIDDFLDKEVGGEAYFLANTIVNDLAIFSLRTRQHWIGSGKWMFRELSSMDSTLANQFEQSLEAFYKQHDKRPIVQLVDDCLKPFGGRLFEGYYLG